MPLEQWIFFVAATVTWMGGVFVVVARHKKHVEGYSGRLVLGRFTNREWMSLVSLVLVAGILAKIGLLFQASSPQVAGMFPAPPTTSPPKETQITRSGPAGLEYSDSVGLFDPGGYFSPRDSVVNGGLRLKTLELHVVNYYYEGAIHYDKPRVLLPPMAGVGTGLPGDERSVESACTVAVLSADSLALQCPNTPLGDIMINGHFTVRSGWYWDKGFSEDSALLVARVILERNGVTLYDRLTRFTCFEGD